MNIMGKPSGSIVKKRMKNPVGIDTVFSYVG